MKSPERGAAATGLGEVESGGHLDPELSVKIGEHVSKLQEQYPDLEKAPIERYSLALLRDIYEDSKRFGGQILEAINKISAKVEKDQ